MEYEPDGAQELLIDSAQEKTAKHTRHLLLSARFTFVFFHGLLIISMSVALQWQTATSWWLVFLPAWLGDALSLLLVVISWFGSCPYIHLCLQERQARLGDGNPSILTEILPDIFFGILSFIYLILALIGEILLCRYLARLQKAPTAAPTSCAVFLIIVSLLTCCRGVCIFTSGEIFSLLGFGALTSITLSLSLSESLFHTAWAIVLPWLPVVAALQVALFCRWKKLRAVLCREERILRVSEQLLLSVIFVTLAVLVLELSPYHVGQNSGAGA
ncbi:unnamed protein product [Durusdinium trenchii]|uniref:Transmembrane protein n=1 Tax=Durusdinium trenchii TaxID=1381693 RepID=A0ABP0N868_9DINO